MIKHEERKWTSAEVPDQHGRVTIITGANSGTGFDVAKVLAARGATVILAVRDVAKGKQTASRIAASAPGACVTVQHLDLTSLSSIHDAADELRTNYPRIDLLINNARVMFTPKRTTKDGFELQFGTNHLGHFALTCLLLENMMSVTGSRVVTVSSIAHWIQHRINFDDLQWERSYDPIAAYGQSKLANLMFTYELQRRLCEINAKTIAVAAHPGNVQTDLYYHWPKWARGLVRALDPFLTQSAPMGALSVLRAATDPKVRGGEYYGPHGFQELTGYPVLVESSAASHNMAIQRFLWAVSEHLTDVEFSPSHPMFVLSKSFRTGVSHQSTVNRILHSTEGEVTRTFSSVASCAGKDLWWGKVNTPWPLTTSAAATSSTPAPALPASKEEVLKNSI